MRRSGSYQKFNTRGILFVWHEETVGGGEQHWGCKSASLTGPENGKGHAMQKKHFLNFWDKCAVLRYCLHILLSTPHIEWARLAGSLCEEKEAEERLESPICLEQEQRKGGFLLYSLYYSYQPSNNLISADPTAKYYCYCCFCSCYTLCTINTNRPTT